MARPTLHYEKMVQNALRNVVRDALAVAAEHGLPGMHHFYVTFRTGAPGVDMPEFLRTQYPDEMTVVIEHRFWGLEVDAEKFAVTLSFKGQGQRLTVPFAAVTAFADPSVKFVLDFHAGLAPAAAPAPPDKAPEQPIPTPPSEGVAEVVKLDAFRKK